MHVHVQSPNGEAEFWLEPVIALAQLTGLSRREISEHQRELFGALERPQISSV